MTRVLLASPSGKETGGIGKWTEHILSYYQQHQDDVAIDLLPTGRENVGKLLHNRFLRIYKGVCAYKVILKKESLMLKKNKYDVIHLASSASIGLLKDYIMLKKAKKGGLKTIIHFHFGRIPKLYQSKNLEWKMLAKVAVLCDNVIVLDELSLNTLREAGVNHTILLPNPIAPRVLEEINRYKDSQRKERTILFVGHGYWAKGIRELVLACNQIPDIHLIMMGAIEENNKEELLQIAHHAAWLDIRGDSSYEDVIKEMTSCSVFALPTYTEGFPNVILESMACGCPIVTTDVGAIPEMLDIKNGFNCGICVKPKDVNGLRDAISTMLENKDYARKCGENAKLRVNELYSMPKIWNNLLTIWNQY